MDSFVRGTGAFYCCHKRIERCMTCVCCSLTVHRCSSESVEAVVVFKTSDDSNSPSAVEFSVIYLVLPIPISTLQCVLYYCLPAQVVPQSYYCYTCFQLGSGCTHRRHTIFVHPLINDNLHSDVDQPNSYPTYFQLPSVLVKDRQAYTALSCPCLLDGAHSLTHDPALLQACMRY